MKRESDYLREYLRQECQQFETEVSTGTKACRELLPDSGLVGGASLSIDAVCYDSSGVPIALIEAKVEPNYKALGQLAIYSYFHSTEHGYEPETVQQTLVAGNVSGDDYYLLSTLAGLGVVSTYRDSSGWRDFSAPTGASTRPPDELGQWVAAESHETPPEPLAEHTSLFLDWLADQYPELESYWNVPVGRIRYPMWDTAPSIDLVVKAGTDWTLVTILSDTSDPLPTYLHGLGKSVATAQLFQEEWGTDNRTIRSVVLQPTIPWIIGVCYRTRRYDDSMPNMWAAAADDPTQPIPFGPTEAYVRDGNSTRFS